MVGALPKTCYDFLCFMRTREGGQENNQCLVEMYHYGSGLVCEVRKEWKNSSEKQLLTEHLWEK